MPYFTGKNVKVFWSTENTTYGLSQSGNDLTATSWSAASKISDFVVPPLRTTSWNGLEADVTGSQPARAREIADLEGAAPRFEHENEDIDFLGRVVQDHLRQRKIGEIVITKKMASNDYAIVYDKANAGVVGSAINEADEQTTTDSGLRIFVRVSGGTGSGHIWYTLRNGPMTKHEVRTTPARTTVEALTFQSNIWDIQQQPFVTPTSASEL